MTGVSCASCIHFDVAVKDRDTCAAFTDGIPLRIRRGLSAHRTPVEGDGGITWAPKPGFEYLEEPLAVEEVEA